MLFGKYRYIPLGAQLNSRGLCSRAALPGCAEVAQFGSFARRMSIVSPKSSQGLSLIEVMVAMALLAIVLSAMVANMSTLTNTTDFAKEQEQANNVMFHVVEKLQTIDFTAPEKYDPEGDAVQWFCAGVFDNGRRCICGRHSGEQAAVRANSYGPDFFREP